VNRVLVRPALFGATLLLAICVALIAAEQLLEAPWNDLEQLALFLSVSGALSLLLASSIVGWTSTRLETLRSRVTIAFLAGLLVALVNVLATSALMFLSGHDLALLFVLLGFSGAISITFALVFGATLTAEVRVLSQAADRLAEGDLGARVDPRGRDELARLGATFNHMASRLERAFEQQRALEASRRELVAAVSHDLRTPLATTRAMVEAVDDGVVAEPSEVRRYLRLINREIQHLTQLIDDLFELSQLECGALELHLEDVEVGATLAETMALYEARLRERDVHMTTTVQARVLHLDADPARLDRLLRNLVDNALRYTPAGGQIELRALDNNGSVEFVVNDSGPGIAEGERERVFDRFYRGERSRARSEQVDPGAAGTGLGLAITRGLVEAHHGQIWVETSALGGASFHVRLPRHPPAATGGALRELQAL
jgi:signal transduction histidine kinase